MRKVLLIAGLLAVVSCEEKEIKQQENWVRIDPEVVKLDCVRELWVIRHGDFVDIAICRGDSVTGYDEAYNFFGLDSNEVKNILNVLEDKSSVNINQLKNALRERLELDRVVYETSLKTN